MNTIDDFLPTLSELWELLEEMNERFTGFDVQDGEKIALLLPSVIAVWKAVRHGL